MLPFGIGIPEVLMIFVVVLLVVGPSKLPELARTLGKGLRAARRAGSEIRNALDFDEPLNKVQREWVDPIFHDDVTADTEYQMKGPEHGAHHSDGSITEPAEARDEPKAVSRGSATSSRVYLDAAGGPLEEEIQPQEAAEASTAVAQGEADPVSDDGTS